ncbi:Cu,Zn superoxide dismutase-like protein [Melanomma pulvis-pyrius CBS 109.77]|uniref:superoxide dismutase n=1 Tax=Melanomma pulvis-pyrius CBS 109.77 TaxID=1314802 RepID=A0A6A6XGV6_9PLEO|nr:Cu,Zn superoxide dismutase-like protein [Melanomma pulvis-pyrius CBS 109.77]
MRASILSLFAVASLAFAEDAPVVANNPAGASYLAKLPTKEGSALQGSVSAVSNGDGKGVLIAVAIAGLPKEGGPFMYHIHEKPVAADGNCSSTGAHLDPYKRGEQPACDPKTPQNCQTGDLSGKHGNITEQQFSGSYSDLYLATNPSDLSYLGNLSIVVHLSNKTRISCANFSVIAAGVSSSSSAPVSVGTSSGYALPTGGHNGTASATATGTNGPTGTPISPTSSTTSLPSSGAQKLAAGAGALAAGVAALML